MRAGMAVAELDMEGTGTIEGAHCSRRDHGVAGTAGADSRRGQRRGAGPPSPSPILRAMNLSRSLPWLIAAAALAGALGLYLGQRHFSPAAGPDALPTRAAVVFPEPRQLAGFQLDRSTGGTLSLADWRGHWSLVFIGFTRCPDACPQTLAVYRDIEKAWPQEAGPIPTLYFVSVDPERDDADALTGYARFFSERIVAATAGHDQLGPFTRQLGMIYMTTPTGEDDYTVDHSTQLAVVGPDARLHALFRAPLDAQSIIGDLQVLQAANRTIDP